MALLTSAQRAEVWGQYMRENSAARLPFSLTKTDVRAAVDAVDAWADANAAAFNLALPLAARNALTPAQKALLLLDVVAKRYLSGV